MQGWGDEAVCTEKRDKSRKDTGKKEEDKGGCGSRGHLVQRNQGPRLRTWKQQKQRTKNKPGVERDRRRERETRLLYMRRLAMFGV